MKQRAGKLRILPSKQRRWDFVAAKFLPLMRWKVYHADKTTLYRDNRKAWVFKGKGVSEVLWPHPSSFTPQPSSPYPSLAAADQRS